ncbi:MAG: ABC transporter permease, partial [Lactobacillus iners]|nr:ABC transporter permease [Lactobacillus iners]
MRIQKIISSIWKQSIEEFLIYRATSLITFILAVVFLLIELFVGDIYFSNSENANW